MENLPLYVSATPGETVLANMTYLGEYPFPILEISNLSTVLSTIKTSYPYTYITDYYYNKNGNYSTLAGAMDLDGFIGNIQYNAAGDMSKLNKFMEMFHCNVYSTSTLYKMHYWKVGDKYIGTTPISNYGYNGVFVENNGVLQYQTGYANLLNMGYQYNTSQNNIVCGCLYHANSDDSYRIITLNVNSDGLKIGFGQMADSVINVIKNMPKAVKVPVPVQWNSTKYGKLYQDSCEINVSQ